MRKVPIHVFLWPLLLLLCVGFPACGGDGGGGGGTPVNCGLMAPGAVGVPGSTPTVGAGTLPTPSEQMMIEEVFAQVNAERVARGIAPLAWGTLALFNVTQNHTLYQESIGTLTHDGPGPCVAPTDCLGNRLTAGGIPSPPRTMWGENVAQGQVTAQQVMNSWMNSAGHCANILNAGFTSISISVQVGMPGGPYWTQVFTTP
jgi:uncharacterized protein YkwD